MRYGVVADGGIDALVFALNKSLPKELSQKFDKMESSFFSKYSQVRSNKERTEIWITYPPKWGLEEIADSISKYTEVAGQYNVTKSSLWVKSFGIIFDIFLIISFCGWVYIFAYRAGELFY